MGFTESYTAQHHAPQQLQSLLSNRLSKHVFNHANFPYSALLRPHFFIHENGSRDHDIPFENRTEPSLSTPDRSG